MKPDGATAGPAVDQRDQGGPLLQVRHLCKQFSVQNRGWRRQASTTVHAVNDLSFDLWPGETLGLVGESGSGKTTTARCIVRALTPTAGEIRFRDHGRVVDLARLPNRALKPLRPSLQLIFQDHPVGEIIVYY